MSIVIAQQPEKPTSSQLYYQLQNKPKPLKINCKKLACT